LRVFISRKDAKAQRKMRSTDQRLPQDVAQAADHLLPPGRRKPPFHQQQGAFFFVLAATDLNPGRLHRLAQPGVKVLQQAVAIEVPAHFQREVIRTHHGVEKERIVIGPLIRGSGVTFENESATAGFPT
jgi:hypothetical protein